jgi:peptidoglycan/xylan/chitin deacetylase (PgdA/CDA1 family)
VLCHVLRKLFQGKEVRLVRNQIRACTSACFYYSGLVSLLRWWNQRSGPFLIILCYHRVDTGNLRSHLLYLRRHFRILPLETALEELYAPHKKGVRIRDRRTLLALTFDDGYYDSYTHAFQLARELKLPITVFLIPGYMESGNSFWWADHLLRLARVERVEVAERSYCLSRPSERNALAQMIDARIQQVASTGEQDEFLASLCKVLHVPASVMPEEKPAPLLDWAQVREMEESGWVSFGAHTMLHTDLSHLVDPDEVRREVRGCRTMLERQLGHGVHSFAYPFGSVDDQALRAVRLAGYNWACTAEAGFNTRESEPHLLRRRLVDADQHWLIVAAETSGIWFFLSHLKSVARLLLRKPPSLARTVGK